VSRVGPAVAGRWYPSDTEELRRDVDRRLVAAGGGPLRAIVAPHAGFAYSGNVAGAGFGPLAGRAVDRVLLIGPSHYYGFRGAVIPRAAAYRTPLGDVPIDRDAAATLARHPGFREDDGPFGPEHSLEAELPFLQRALAPGWSALPVLVGAFDGPVDAGSLADALQPLADERTLVVVSSDFTHYGDGFGYVPFRDRVEERLRELDLGAVREIEKSDAGSFRAYCEETGVTICGRRPIEILLRLSPGEPGRLIAYDTSGRMTGDWSHTVSYAAIGFARRADA
jgi:hypothetical protein